MTSTEFQRLRAYWLAARTSQSHRPTLSGKRAAKGAAKGYGQILKTSHIHAMSMETQTSQRKHNRV